jgi:hypothetical protein
MMVATIRSCGPNLGRAYAWATRFSPSVVLRTKMTPRSSAETKRATSRLACSKISVARSPRAWTPRWTLALAWR